jgi:hypothetical protein
LGLNVYVQAQVHVKNGHLPKVLEDPLFGIGYDPLVVHYDSVSASFLKVCPAVFEHEFVYAHIKSGKSDYYIISGYSSDQDGDSFGHIALVNGNRCDTYDSKNAFSGVPPENGYKENEIIERIPGKDASWVRDPGESGVQGNFHYILRSAHEEAIIRALVQDGFLRGIRAYGSADKFRKLACSPEQIKALSYFPNVVEEQELKSICSKDSAEISLPGIEGE